MPDRNAPARSVSAQAPQRTRLFSPRVTIVVPTYREAGNIKELVERLDAALNFAAAGVEVLIVDDNSRDGTQRVCSELAERFPLRLIVRRSERGLASAVVRGIEEARGDLVVVMDADLSHPPEVVKYLLRKLDDTNVEFVIGSRYVDGGSVARDWGIWRRLNSTIATWLARPLVNVRDPMSGYFAFRRTILDQAGRIVPIGFKIGLELLVKCSCQKVVEVPITFSPRLYGTSKLTFGERVKYLRQLIRLYAYRASALLRQRVR